MTITHWHAFTRHELTEIMQPAHNNGTFLFQWLEESYTNGQNGANWRTYVACDVRKDYVNNWLRTPFIQRGDANRLSIELTFTMRDCRKFPYTARTCKETFTLLAYEADLDFANSGQPPWTEIGFHGY